jgi:hypothetical protein
VWCNGEREYEDWGNQGAVVTHCAPENQLPVYNIYVSDNKNDSGVKNTKNGARGDGPAPDGLARFEYALHPVTRLQRGQVFTPWGYDTDHDTGDCNYYRVSLDRMASCGNDDEKYLAGYLLQSPCQKELFYYESELFEIREVERKDGVVVALHCVICESFDA